MLKATRFLILRGVKNGGKYMTPVAEKPLRVATLLDEWSFGALGCAMLHLKTVFFEDRVHDWDCTRGQFRYYSRVCEPGETMDVLLVYEEREVTYCPECGREAGACVGKHATGRQRRRAIAA